MYDPSPLHHATGTRRKWILNISPCLQVVVTVVSINLSSATHSTTVQLKTNLI